MSLSPRARRTIVFHLVPLLSPVNDWHPHSKQPEPDLSEQDQHLHCAGAAERGREWKEVYKTDKSCRPELFVLWDVDQWCHKPPSLCTPLGPIVALVQICFRLCGPHPNEFLPSLHLCQFLSVAGISFSFSLSLSPSLSLSLSVFAFDFTPSATKYLKSNPIRLK